ncbi:MAG: bacterioferritin-associated ferredoxin [Pseudomonadota bacterium]
MYVCLCNRVTDTQIRAAVAQGASSMRDIRRQLGVASQCGKCGTMTSEIMREALLQGVESDQMFYQVS